MFNALVCVELESACAQTLSREQAAELAGLLATDLAALFPALRQSQLTVAGALYPIEQCLQPELPLHQRLLQYSNAALPGADNAEGVLAIGASDGEMPAGLQPHKQNSRMLVWPFVLQGLEDDLRRRTEAQLMHRGLISPSLYTRLSEVLGARPVHANFMSTLDLAAMMRTHFVQLGHEPIWDIVEQALFNPHRPLSTATAQGNHFHWCDGVAYTPFFSLHKHRHWFSQADADYSQWTAQQRLAVHALLAHGIEVRNYTPVIWPEPDGIDRGIQVIQTNHYVEEHPRTEDSDDRVRQISDAEAGTLAVVQPLEHSELWYYPLNREGLEEIKAWLRPQPRESQH